MTVLYKLIFYIGLISILIYCIHMEINGPLSQSYNNIYKSTTFKQFDSLESLECVIKNDEQYPKWRRCFIISFVCCLFILISEVIKINLIHELFIIFLIIFIVSYMQFSYYDYHYYNPFIKKQIDIIYNIKTQNNYN
jgi:hypothetical protein